MRDGHRCLSKGLPILPLRSAWPGSVWRVAEGKRLERGDEARRGRESEEADGAGNGARRTCERLQE